MRSQLKKWKRKVFSPSLGFEPWSPGTESQYQWATQTPSFLLPLHISDNLGVFCEDPPVPDPLLDMTTIKNPSYYSLFGNSYRVPENGIVTFKCNAFGRFDENYDLNTLNITCSNLTDGSNEEFEWQSCKRSMFFKPVMSVWSILFILFLCWSS